MNRYLFSGLPTLAITLVLLAPPEQANAYDDFPVRRVMEPPYWEYDEHYHPHFYLPSYDCGDREGCNLRRFRCSFPDDRRFLLRDRIPLTDRFAPAEQWDRSNRDPFRQPEFATPFYGVAPPVPPQKNDLQQRKPSHIDPLPPGNQTPETSAPQKAPSSPKNPLPLPKLLELLPPDQGSTNSGNPEPPFFQKLAHSKQDF